MRRRGPNLRPKSADEQPEIRDLLGERRRGTTVAGAALSMKRRSVRFTRAERPHAGWIERNVAESRPGAASCDTREPVGS